MNLKITTSILALLLVFSSCENNASKAADYNNQLINAVKELRMPLIVIEKSVYNDFLNGDKEKVIIDCKKAIDHIEKIRQKIKAVNPPKIPRAKDLQTGCMNLLEWNKFFYEKFSKMAENISENDEKKSFKELEECVENMRAAEAMLEELQQDFAHKNGAEVSSY